MTSPFPTPVSSTPVSATPVSATPVSATLPAGPERRPGSLPVLHADARGDAVAWAARHREALRAAVLEHGSLLVRGLELADADTVAAVTARLTDRLGAEREAFAPRQPRPGGLYTATPWPANQQMCLHHELSYALEFPGLLLFACLTAPDTGGATPVADAAAVLDALPADLVARFERTGWLLLRSYTDEIGAPWPEAFGTDDRGRVEAYCRANAIEVQWQPGGGLRTRQRRSAVVTHPVTGRRCWFNQVAFLSEWTLAEEVREYLLDLYGPEGLPFTTAFGDGSPIGPDVVALLAEVYDRHTARTPWRDGDLLLVDNVRTAHGRDAYTGQREVLVALADPVPLAACAPTAGGGTP